MIDTLHASATVGVERAGGDLTDFEAPVDRLGELRAKQQTVIGKQSRWAASQGDLLVDKNVGRAFCRELGGGDGVHVGAAAEAAREERDVDVSSGRDGEGAKVIDVDCLAGAIGQRQRNDGPPYSMS